MSTRPRHLSLDTGSLDLIKDLTPARVGVIGERTQHALMSGFGGPPQCRSCYITATRTISYRVPPGVTEVNIAALIAAGALNTGTVTFTTSVDGVGTLFAPVGDAIDDVAAATWISTAGFLAQSAGAESGRALTVRSAVAWTWADVDINVTVTPSSTIVLFALIFSPIHTEKLTVHSNVIDLLFALFAAGFTVVDLKVTDKYTYSGDVVAGGTDLGTARYGLAAAGTTTVGIFAAGYADPPGLATAVTDKYTYSGDTVAAGTALGTARSALAAAGNTTTGIFGAGLIVPANTAVTDKYTYSGDTVAAGTALGTARKLLTAAGNATVGIFGGGYTTANTAVTDKYTYSGDTVAAGTALGTARRELAAAGNATVGIFGGGSTGAYTAVTEKYTYSGDVVAFGTALVTARQFFAAASSSPGHL